MTMTMTMTMTTTTTTNPRPLACKKEPWILYENVYEADGVSYDAVVSFVSIDGGSCTDYDNTSSTQNNIPRWFSLVSIGIQEGGKL